MPCSVVLSFCFQLAPTGCCKACSIMQPASCTVFCTPCNTSFATSCAQWGPVLMCGQCTTTAWGLLPCFACGLPESRPHQNQQAPHAGCSCTKTCCTWLTHVWVLFTHDPVLGGYVVLQRLHKKSGSVHLVRRPVSFTFEGSQATSVHASNVRLVQSRLVMVDALPAGVAAPTLTPTVLPNCAGHAMIDTAAIGPLTASQLST